MAVCHGLEGAVRGVPEFFNVYGLQGFYVTSSKAEILQRFFRDFLTDGFWRKTDASCIRGSALDDGFLEKALAEGQS